MTLVLITVYSRLDVFIPRCFITVLFISDCFTDIWCLSVSLELGRLVFYSPLSFYRSHRWTADAPLVYTDFWLSRWSKCCRTYSGWQNLLHLFEPWYGYFLLILFHRAFVVTLLSVLFLADLWLNIVWGPLSKAWLLYTWFFTHEYWRRICGAIMFSAGLCFKLGCASLLGFEEPHRTRGVCFWANLTVSRLPTRPGSWFERFVHLLRTSLNMQKMGRKTPHFGAFLLKTSRVHCSLTLP